MTESLHECPFCGGEANLRVIEPHTHTLYNVVGLMLDYGGGAFVECPGCASAMAGETTAGVVAAWNTRAADAEIDRLTAELAAAMNDIPRKCWSCKHSWGQTGNECNLLHYHSGSIVCQSWQWRESAEAALRREGK